MVNEIAHEYLELVRKYPDENKVSECELIAIIAQKLKLENNFVRQVIQRQTTSEKEAGIRRLIIAKFGNYTFAADKLGISKQSLELNMRRATKKFEGRVLDA